MKLFDDICLPDELGFEIYIDTFQKFFDSEEDYNNFIYKLNVKNTKISVNYGLNNIGFTGDANLCIKSYDGKKRIVTDELCIINWFYKYFNSNIINYEDTIYFDQTDEEVEELFIKAIDELKLFISSKIKDLKNVKTIGDLRSISNYLYKSCLSRYNIKKGENIKTLNEILLSDIEIDDYIKTFNRIKYWLKDIIVEYSNVPNEEELYKNINIDKFKYFLAYQLLLIHSDYGKYDKIYATLFIYNAIKMFESINNKEIEFDKLIFARYIDECSRYGFIENINYSSLKEHFNSYLEKPHSKMIIKYLDDYKSENLDVKLNDRYLSDIINLICNAIEVSNKKGFKDVDLEKLYTDTKNKLTNETTIEKQNKLRSYINRIEFYKFNAKPFIVQEGSGLFNDSFIMYFKNGVVAIDKLNGEYGYLYIMPIKTYFDLLENKDIRNLIEIRSIITVKPISHKKINWKEEAIDVINNHNMSEEEFNILESINGIMLPIDESDIVELKKKYSDNQYILNQIKEKEIERKNKYEEIDKELNKTDFTDYDDYSETTSLLKAEEEIMDNCSNVNDLISIYDYDPKNKTKRNPKVSLDTKKRTINDNGAMRCEMCGEFESFDTRNFEAHHIIPLSLGGVDNLYNTVCLCGTCHNKIHANVPFTYEMRWNMLMNVRKNLNKTTPYYVKNFDKLFNPYYNYIYNNNLSNDELEVLYSEEEKYYNEHKEEEDYKFIVEWNANKTRAK